MKGFMKKLTFLVLSSLLHTHSAYAFNMAYVEVNYNNIENTSCYVRSDNNKTFFNVVSIFAANINGESPNAPEIFFNDKTVTVLHSSAIQHLQNKGMKVLITLLGNHQNAGWSCMTDPYAAKKFADKIVNLVNYYHLDGVDIDDEYSTCLPNNYSITMIAEAIKSNPKFSGKLLTKALYADSDYFQAIYNGHKLSDYLDYGWEMSYSDDDFENRIDTYLENGMTANKLMIGSWTALDYPNPYDAGQFGVQMHLAGNMVYDITNTSQNYLTRLIKSEDDKLEVKTLPNCLNE